MRCRYCFYADISDSRELKNCGVMSLDTLELIVRKALATATKHCVFGFQGGEPTLAGLDFFRALIEFEQKHNIHQAQISRALQTNGLLIDENWASFLAKHDFLVGLSIDAGIQIHDGLRRDTGDKGTHSRCMKTARILSRHGVRLNILSVVTRPLAENPDKAYAFYKKNGFDFIQFIPCLDKLGEPHARSERAERHARAEHTKRLNRRDNPLSADDYSLDAGLYGEFLCRVFDLWHADFTGGRYISIRAFDNYIHMLAGYPPENCGMAGVCNAYPLIEADGSVYPCDFYAIDEYLLGNIKTSDFAELSRTKSASEFNSVSRTAHPVCEKCDYYPICRGGCRRDREPVADGVLSLNKYCESYKVFFEHALPRMMQVARQVFPEKFQRKF